MTLAELLPKLESLPKTDKLRVMQFLAQELVKEEEQSLKADQEYSIWTPFHAYDAAAVLQDFLNREKEEHLE
jgi:hypothetical protein